MKLIQNIKNNLQKGAQNNLSLAIYSILLAILVWFVIAMTLYPSVPKTIEDITLQVDISGSNASANGLSVISCDVSTVNIRIKGSRTQVGMLDSDSFTAYFNADNVTTPGQKKLNIEVRSNRDIKYEIESISPSTANVVFDEFKNIEVKVQPMLPNVKVSDGKTIYDKELSCEPDIITITGPSAQLDKIKNVYAVSDKEMTLDSTYNLMSDRIELYTADGAVIDQSKLKFSSSNVYINIPVITQKTVELKAELLRVPQSFKTDNIKLKISPESITIASKNNQVELPDTLEVAQIYLRDLVPGYSKTFDIKSALSSSDLINLSNVETVTVSLENTELAKKDIIINLDNIRLTNKPDTQKFDYELLTKSVPAVLVGPQDVLDLITNDDVFAEANLLGNNSTLDQFTYEVTIYCPSYDNVWAVNQSNVLIKKVKVPEDS